MGRTQHTYRMRLRQVRSRMLKLLPVRNRKDYHEAWSAAQYLSAPASTFPFQDTHAVITFSMVLEVIKRIQALEKKLILNEHPKIDDTN